MHFPPFDIALDYFGKIYRGKIYPHSEVIKNGFPAKFNITLNGAFLGAIENTSQGWIMDNIGDKELVNSIGRYIELWYE
jgi:hypothetical protein